MCSRCGCESCGQWILQKSLDYMKLYVFCTTHGWSFSISHFPVPTFVVPLFGANKTMVVAPIKFLESGCMTKLQLTCTCNFKTCYPRCWAYPIFFLSLVCIDNNTRKQKTSPLFHFCVLLSTQTEEQISR